MSTELVLIHLSHFKFHLSADIEGLGLKHWMLAKRLLSAVCGWMLIIGCGTKRWQNLVEVVAIFSKLGGYNIFSILGGCNIFTIFLKLGGCNIFTIFSKLGGYNIFTCCILRSPRNPALSFRQRRQPGA